MSIYFAQCLIGFWIIIIPAGHTTSTVSYTGSFLLIAIGLLAAAGQLILTEGYRYFPISTGALVIITSPVMNIVAGVLFFGEALTINTMTGSLVILLSSTFLIVSRGKTNISEEGGKMEKVAT